jgi:hypothetical protein
MDPKIQALLDKQAITEVQARYCRTLDWLDEAGLASVFWPDADIDYGFFVGSGEDFIPFVMQVEKSCERRWHNLTNLSIKLDGNDAEVECYGIAQSTSSRNGIKTDQMFGGRYLDAFEKRDDEWRISKRKFILDWTQSFDHGLDAFREGRMSLPILDIREPDHAEYREL